MSLLYSICQEDKFGYIDSSGEICISFQFDDAGDFAEGLAYARTSDGYGFIDTMGRWIIPPSYSVPDNFSEGLVAVCQHDKWGYLNHEGQWVIPPLFDCALSFSEGLAGVAIGKQWFFIDRNGKKRLGEYQHLFGFSEGCACVMLDRGRTFVNSKGQIVTDFFRENCTMAFHSGFAWVESEKKYGFIKSNGKWVITPEFDKACDFSEGLAAVLIGEHWGYIRMDGTFAISPKLPARRMSRNTEMKWSAPEFHEGLAAAWDGNFYGYIDCSGQWVIPPAFSRPGDFCGGITSVVKEKHWLLIDRNGQKIWPRED